MKRKMLFPIFYILIIMNLYSETTLTKSEHIITNNDPNYGIIEKIITYSQDNIPVFSEAYFTDSVKMSKGRIKQVNYINSEQIPYKYENYYTNQYCQKWGIKKSVEILDENKIVELIYTYYDDTEVSFTNRELVTVQKFPPELLQNKNNIFKTNNASSDIKSIYTELGYGSSLVSIESNPEKLTDDEIQFIYQYFMSQHGMEKFAQVGWRKIRCIENGVEVIFYYNEIVYQYMQFTKGKGVIFYHFLGGIGQTPINMITASISTTSE